MFTVTKNEPDRIFFLGFEPSRVQACDVEAEGAFIGKMIRGLWSVISDQTQLFTV